MHLVLCGQARMLAHGHRGREGLCPVDPHVRTRDCGIDRGHAVVSQKPWAVRGGLAAQRITTPELEVCTTPGHTFRHLSRNLAALKGIEGRGGQTLCRQSARDEAYVNRPVTWFKMPISIAGLPRCLTCNRLAGNRRVPEDW